MLPFVFGAGALRHGRKVTAIYAAGRTERVEGPLRKIAVRHTSRVYAIGGKPLGRISERGFKTIIDGAVYRAHYVPQLDRLLTIEPVDRS